MLKPFHFLAFLLATSTAFSQDMDVQRYRFFIKLSDASDSIQGLAPVSLKRIKPVTSFSLDLVQSKGRSGMTVSNIAGSRIKSWSQADDKIRIELDGPVAIDEMQTYSISYSGIPADGLIISKNK